MDTLPDSQQPSQSQSQSFTEEPGGLPKQGLVDPETAKAYQVLLVPVLFILINYLTTLHLTDTVNQIIYHKRLNLVTFVRRKIT